MTQERFINTLHYAMLGNILGAKYEALPVAEIKKRRLPSLVDELRSNPISEKGANYGVGLGNIVDESYLMLVIAKVLTDEAMFYPPSFEKIIKELRDIPTEFEFETALHNFIFNLIHSGKASPVSARSYIFLAAVPPIVLQNLRYNDRTIFQISKVIKYFTDNELVLDSALVYGKILRAFLQNEVRVFEDILDMAYSISTDKELREAFARARDLLDATVDEAVFQLGNGETVTEVLPLSFWLYRQYGREPMELLRQAIMAGGELGGKTDALGFFVGSLLGASGAVLELNDALEHIQFYEEAREYAIDLYHLAYNLPEKPIRLEVLDNDN